MNYNYCHCSENVVQQTFVEEEEDVVVGNVVDISDHLEFDVVYLGHIDGPRTTSAATDCHRPFLVRLADHRVRPTVSRKLHVIVINKNGIRKQADELLTSTTILQPSSITGEIGNFYSENYLPLYSTYATSFNGYFYIIDGAWFTYVETNNISVIPETQHFGCSLV